MESPLYRVTIDGQGVVHLTLTLHDLGDVHEVLLEVPTWVAGAYAFLRYGRDLYATEATSGDGPTLHIERAGLSGFRVVAAGTGTFDTLFFSARVQARDAAWGELSGLLGPSGGIFLPTAMPVVAGWRGPVDVELHAGEGRGVLVAGVTEKTTRPECMRFASFDSWLDTPIVVGSPVVVVREVRGCRFEHVFCQKTLGFEAEIGSFIDDLVRVAEACHDLFGHFPFKRYTWIISFDPRDHWGLEHAHSTMIAIGEDALIDDEVRFCALRVAAHELFHAWNVWRLRPDAFRLASRTEGAFTDALWLCEGFTRYYEFVLLMRAGLMGPERLLENIVSFHSFHTARPAYAHTTLVDSSLATFLNHTRWPGAWNATLDYYDGGMLVAFELDALLRTRFSSSLDELFAGFYKKYENKSGFDTAAFEGFLVERFSALEGWISRKVRQPASLDVEGALRSLGFSVERKASVRVGVVFEPKGALVVAQVLEGSPAHAAGLCPGDEITIIDGYRATVKGFSWATQRGQSCRLFLRRGHAFHEVELRGRPVDEWVALRVAGSLAPAAVGLFGPCGEAGQAGQAGQAKRAAAAWPDGHRTTISHYDNFHGTERIH